MLTGTAAEAEGVTGAGDEGEEEEEEEEAEEDEDDEEDDDDTLAVVGTAEGFPCSSSPFRPPPLLAAVAARDFIVPCGFGGVFLSVDAAAAAPSLADFA